ncbi:MAG: N-formylglutamate amidohydrolase [Rhodospirillaceae bacterium]
MPTTFDDPPQGLLGPDDPPPFEVVNLDGTAPLLLVCDHASRTVPAGLDNLGLPDDRLAEHIGWDIGAAAVTRALAERLNAPAVLCGYSRLVIDCNRLPGDPTSIPPVSDATAVPGNQDLTEVEQQARTDAVFWPYHRAIGDALAHLWRRLPGVAPALISLHSFTPCMRSGAPRPWHAGLLWNRDPRLVVPLLSALRTAEPGLVVGDNEPYDGRTVNYTLDLHAGAAGLPHVAVEIRQDLIADDAGAAAWSDRLAAVLDPLLGDPHIHRVHHY